MPRLTIISQYFYPSLSATSQLMTDLSKGLVSEGYDIHIYTAVPAEHSPNSPKSFKISPDESGINRLHIHRSYCPIQSGTSILGKLLSSFFFMVGAAIFLIFKQPKQTPILITSNPPYAGLLGILFKWIRGGNYTFLLQDIFPESAVIAGLLSENGWVRAIADWINFQSCHQAKQTVVLSPSMRDFLQRKYPKLSIRVEVIENWAIADIPPCLKSENSFAQEHQLTDTFTVLYSGNMGRLHDIETILTAAKRLEKESIQFVFIGKGAKAKLVQQAIDQGCNNIKLLPFQPREKLPLTLTACDVAIVSLRPGAESIVAPSKLYGMLAAGRAILALSVPGSDLENLVLTHNCGVNVAPQTPRKLAQQILKLSHAHHWTAELGQNARKLYQKHYRFERALVEYQTLLGQTSSCDAYGVIETQAPQASCLG